MDGRTRREERALLDGAPLDLAWRVAAVEDLSRDGRPDVVFQHQVDGRLAVAVMRGLRFVDAFLLTAVSPGWRIAASGDLGGDGGTADLVWQHGPTGALAVTFLEGTRLVGAAPLVPAAVPDPAWLLLGPR
jgi:hypothetical protein